MKKRSVRVVMILMTALGLVSCSQTTVDDGDPGTVIGGESFTVGDGLLYEDKVLSVKFGKETLTAMEGNDSRLADFETRLTDLENSITGAYLGSLTAQATGGYFKYEDPDSGTSLYGLDGVNANCKDEFNRNTAHACSMNEITRNFNAGLLTLNPPNDTGWVASHTNYWGVESISADSLNTSCNGYTYGNSSPPASAPKGTVWSIATQSTHNEGADGQGSGTALNFAEVDCDQALAFACCS